MPIKDVIATKLNTKISKFKNKPKDKKNTLFICVGKNNFL